MKAINDTILLVVACVGGPLIFIGAIWALVHDYRKGT